MSLRTAVLALTLAVPSIALGCDEEKHVAKKGVVGELTIAEVAELSKAKAATVLDVNGAQTRQKYGVIPGAKLLTSVNFKTAELPTDKEGKLIFYCANTRCGASKMAAKKAIKEGYSDVAILPVGIAGWKNAGQPTTALPRS